MSLTRILVLYYLPPVGLAVFYLLVQAQKFRHREKP